jgi:MFS family permease
MNGTAPATRTPARSWFLLGVLMLGYMFAFVDRVMLGLLVGPIQRDLGIGDTAFSLVAGFAFALLYTALGLPVGVLVDRRPRIPLIMTGSALWSVATAACGLAGSFAQLFLARVAVGVGEATLSPAASSLIGDAFPPARRGLALSLYSCGITVGGGLALIGGGFLVAAAEALGTVHLPVVGARAGWQIAFLAAGAAGLVVPLLLAAAREPARRAVAAGAAPPPALPWLRANARVVGPIFLGYSLMVIVNYALVLWVPAHFARVHGLSPSQTGLAIGLSLLIAGTAGMLGGGALSDRMVRGGRPHGPILAVLVSIALQLPLFVGAMLVPSTQLAIALLAASAFAICLNGGLQTATVQALAPNPLHGRVTALYLLSANLVGLGVGPTLIALVAERMLGGPQQIGLALALVGGASLLTAASLIAAVLGPARALATEEAGRRIP